MFAEDEERSEAEPRRGVRPTLRGEERPGKDSTTHKRTGRVASFAQVALRTCLLSQRLAPCFRPLRHTGSALRAACCGEAVPWGSRRRPKESLRTPSPSQPTTGVGGKRPHPSTCVFRVHFVSQTLGLWGSGASRGLEPGLRVPPFPPVEWGQ